MSQRRQLHFDMLDDVLSEAQLLLAHGYRRLGNWSLGTMGDHLGRAMIYSCDGFPRQWPRVIQWVARKTSLNRILSRKTWHWRFPAPISVNYQITDQEGVDCLQQGVTRFQQRGPEISRHIVLGEFNRDQWLQFHLWHCEHHFSFLIPRGSGGV